MPSHISGKMSFHKSPNLYSCPERDISVLLQQNSVAIFKNLMGSKSLPTVKRLVHKPHANSGDNPLHKVFMNKCRCVSD